MNCFEFLDSFSSILVEAKPCKELRVFLLQFLCCGKEKSLFVSTEQDSSNALSLSKEFSLPAKNLSFLDLFSESIESKNPFALGKKPNLFVELLESHLRQGFSRLAFDSLAPFTAYSSPAALYHSLFFKNKALRSFKAKALYLLDPMLLEPEIAENLRHTMDLTLKAETNSNSLVLSPEPIDGFKPFKRIELFLGEKGFK